MSAELPARAGARRAPKGWAGTAGACSAAHAAASYAPGPGTPTLSRTRWHLHTRPDALVLKLTARYHLAGPRRADAHPPDADRCGLASRRALVADLGDIADGQRARRAAEAGRRRARGKGLSRAIRRGSGAGRAQHGPGAAHQGGVQAALPRPLCACQQPAPGCLPTGRLADDTERPNKTEYRLQAVRCDIPSFRESPVCVPMANLAMRKATHNVGYILGAYTCLPGYV